jgi:hypothetical protein
MCSCVPERPGHHPIEGGRRPVWLLHSGRVRGSRHTIFGFTLLAALGASVLLAASAHSAAVTKPHALKLLINGKQLRITAFGGTDYYNPIKASKLRVIAKWKGSLTGGYKVQITTTEPHAKVWRTCSSGTSCAVRQQVPMFKGEQMSWTVRLLIKKPHFVKVVAGFMVCLARNVHPS